MASSERLVALASWAAQQLGERAANVALVPLQGGNSHLTLSVRSGGRCLAVLRCGPKGSPGHEARLFREARIMSALAATAIPVPRIIATTSAAETGVALMMDQVAGRCIATPADAESLDGAVRHRVATEMLTALVDLHAVEPADHGLSDLAPRTGYLERQLETWRRHFVDATSAETPPALGARVESVASALQRELPGLDSVVVHGDFRMDNCIVDDDGALRAVLDWELATLGDPIADLATMLVYWTEPGDESPALRSAPTAAGGFPPRRDLATRYGALSGRSIDALAPSIAFAYWRLACIFQGVAHRYHTGALRADTGRARRFQARVPVLLDLARKTLDGDHR